MRTDIINILKFLKEIELLKSVTRHSWTSKGRQESVPEHSWRMALFAMSIKPYVPEVDMGRVIELCLVHDLGEAHEGDEPAWVEQSPNKVEKEEASVQKSLATLSTERQEYIFQLWQEYNTCETPEAQLVKALDKLEVLIQHNEADISTWVPEEHELAFIHGKKYMHFNDFIRAFREVVDEMSRERMEKNTLPY